MNDSWRSKTVDWPLICHKQTDGRILFDIFSKNRVTNAFLENALVTRYQENFDNWWNIEHWMVLWLLLSIDLTSLHSFLWNHMETYVHNLKSIMTIEIHKKYHILLFDIRNIPIFYVATGINSLYRILVNYFFLYE